MHIEQIIRSHPHVKGNTNDALIRCIQECLECASSCVACADACLGEQAVQQLTQCIRLNLDCADVCAATGTVATRRTGSNGRTMRAMLRACADGCRAWGSECARHASHHEDCRVCAEACRRCEQACEEALRSIG